MIYGKVVSYKRNQALSRASFDFTNFQLHVCNFIVELTTNLESKSLALQMETKKFTGIVLQAYTDTIGKVSYIKVLTQDSVECYKLPTSKENYKFGYLLSPKKIITGELIKTRKNWVLTTILETRDLWQPESFADYIRLTQSIVYLSDALKEGEVTDILNKVESYFYTLKETLNPKEFEQFLMKNLGFAG